MTPPRCFQCNGQRVIQGSVIDEAHRQPARFRPQSLRFWTLTFTSGPKLAAAAFACLNCGLVWSSTPTSELTKFVRKHCDEPAVLPPA